MHNKTINSIEWDMQIGIKLFLDESGYKTMSKRNQNSLKMPKL